MEPVPHPPRNMLGWVGVAPGTSVASVSLWKERSGAHQAGA